MKRACNKRNAADRLEELRTIIDVCFGLLDEDLKEVANQTGLCVATLRRIQSDALSLDVRWRTIQAIAWAAGMKLDVTEKGYSFKRADGPKPRTNSILRGMAQPVSAK